MTTGRINQVAHEKTRTHAPKRHANALADKPRDTEQPTPRKCTHAGAGAHSRVGRHASQRTHRQCSHEDRTSRPRMLPRTQENAMARRSQRTLCQEAMDARKTPLGAARAKPWRRPPLGDFPMLSEQPRIAPTHATPSRQTSALGRTTRRWHGPSARGCTADTESAAAGAHAPHSRGGGAASPARCKRAHATLPTG